VMLVVVLLARSCWYGTLVVLVSRQDTVGKFRRVATGDTWGLPSSQCLEVPRDVASRPMGPVPAETVRVARAAFPKGSR
jgi:hypothetical protein